MREGGMITEAHGNLLEADVDAVVNTVNTVGVMGKGIALQFKRAYPEMFKDYSRAAKDKRLRLGSIHVWPTGLMTGPRFIINFPTKGHWRSASLIDDIDRGLGDLIRVVQELGLRSIAVPPLGCGNGGLNWLDVEPLIRTRLEAVEDLDVLLCTPVGAPAAADMPVLGQQPAMTSGRAARVVMMAEYSRNAMAGPSLIETQKLTYFLQEAGEPLKLAFVGHHYGPYADNLCHVLQLLEGLVEGFESAYALELLATVHWVLEHPTDTQELADTASVIDAVRAWSPRKGRMFTPEHIEVAVTALSARGWTRVLADAI